LMRTLFQPRNNLAGPAIQVRLRHV
jgi:hypothetical protein